MKVQFLLKEYVKVKNKFVELEEEWFVVEKEDSYIPKIGDRVDVNELNFFGKVSDISYNVDDDIVTVDVTATYEFGQRTSYISDYFEKGKHTIKL